MERRRAQAVLWTMLVLLLGSAATGLEAWPLSSYRLFSVVRTDSQTFRELVAVDADGTGTPVRFGRDNPAVATTAHLLDDVRGKAPEQQRRMVEAWLVASEVDRHDLTSTRLEVVGRVMDPDSLRWTEVSRSVEAEITL